MFTMRTSVRIPNNRIANTRGTIGYETVGCAGRTEAPHTEHADSTGGGMATYTTHFGSLDGYEKGGVELINDNPKNYVFSNMFEVAACAAP